MESSTNLYDPEGEDWGFELNRVRPIALLEVFRKCVTRIITKRLSAIIKDKNILQGPNFAGLPENSTEEPIHILNSFLEEAHEKKKEMWLLFQDMKKAFDSVSLVMLEKSMRRIRLPGTVINFVINLFSKRRMQVITDYGLTEEFVAEDGIDQGEVISPLVWRIFYDPLLVRVQKDNSLGYTAEVNSFKTNIDRERELNMRQAVLAYADDTTWIACSKKQLERTINIAEQFFQINDIEINGSKSKLVIINSKLPKEESCVFFCKTKLFAEPKLYDVKFLGIYLHTSKDLAKIKRKVKKIVGLFTHVLEKKKVTASQLSYINNQVLLPKLEYILQATALSEKDLENIHQPIIRLCKKKLGIAQTAPNDIIFHGGILGFKSLASSLLAKQATSLLKRLNSNEGLESLAELRIKQGAIKAGILQDVRSVPFDAWHATLWKGNLSCNVIEKCKLINLKFETQSIQNEVCNKEVAIVSFLDERAIKNSMNTRVSLELVSLNQLIDPTGTSLMSWQQVRGIRERSMRGKTPDWFSRIEERVMINKSSRELKREYRLEGESSKLSSPIRKKVRKDKRCKDWVVVRKENSTTHVLGRISKKFTRKAIVEHWVETQKVKGAVRINRCKGCALNKGGKENDCQFSIEMEECISRIDGIVKKENDWLMSFPLSYYRHTAYENAPKDQNSTERLAMAVEVNRIEFEIIKKQGLSSKITNLLLGMVGKNIQEKRSDYVFYTDGSWYKEEEGFEDRMGSAWVQVDKEEETVNLLGKIRVADWPSLTRSELVAILCALLVVKLDSVVVVKTDSLAAISSIENVFRSRSFKKSLKLKNRSILDKIYEVVQVKNLSLELCKVKAHSGIVWNELADSLAKEAAHLEEDWKWIPANPTRWNASLWWNGKHIDTCPRKFILRLTRRAVEGRCLLSSKSLAAEYNHNSDKLDWAYRWARLKELGEVRCRGMESSFKLILRIKGMFQLLPTLNELHARKPWLYKSPNCILCKEETKETMKHLFRCSFTENFWQETENTALSAAWAVLLDEASFLLSVWELSEILLSDSKEVRFKEREVYLSGLVEREKIELFYKKGLSRKDTKTCIDAFLYVVQEGFYRVIWKERCNEVIKWEKGAGIERSLKRKRKVFEVRNKEPRVPELMEAERKDKERKKQKKQEVENSVNELVENSMLSQIRGSHIVSWWMRK